MRWVGYVSMNIYPFNVWSLSFAVVVGVVVFKKCSCRVYVEFSTKEIFTSYPSTSHDLTIEPVLDDLLQYQPHATNNNHQHNKITEYKANCCGTFLSYMCAFMNVMFCCSSRHHCMYRRRKQRHCAKVNVVSHVPVVGSFQNFTFDELRDCTN